MWQMGIGFDREDDNVLRIILLIKSLIKIEIYVAKILYLCAYD